MNIDDIKKVLVVGAGLTGRQIGLQCAIYGFEVVLYDKHSAQLEKAVSGIMGYLKGMVDGGRLSPGDRDASLARLSVIADPARAAEGVDLLIEAVPENPTIKAQVFSQFAGLCPPHAIFATNTSTLLPSMFAVMTRRPSLFAALHFHPDVWESNMVDIMPHPGTSADTIRVLHDFAKRIGQIPIVFSKESSSYIFNAIINAVIATSINLVVEEVASIEDVDRSWMGITKTPSGPFGIMDHVGLDVVLDVHRCWAGIIRDRQLQARMKFLEKYVDQGNLGIKTGKGFYSYPDPAYKSPSFLVGGK